MDLNIEFEAPSRTNKNDGGDDKGKHQRKFLEKQERKKLFNKKVGDVKMDSNDNQKHELRGNKATKVRNIDDEYADGEVEGNHQNQKPEEEEEEKEKIDYADLDPVELERLLATGSRYEKGKKPSSINKPIKKQNREKREFTKPVTEKPIVTKKNSDDEMLEEAIPTKVTSEKQEDQENPDDKRINSKDKVLDEAMLARIAHRKKVFGSCTESKGPKSTQYGQFNHPEQNQAQHNIFTSQTFDDQDILPNLKRRLGDCHYTKLTKIQQKVFSLVKEFKSCIIKAETGSGKTLSYLVPIIDDLLRKPEKIQRKEGAYVLIICPTRELAIQVEKVAKSMTHWFPWIVTGLLVGGEDVHHEKARLRKGLNIVISTPGRTLYHLQKTQSFGMGSLEYLIFEECDRTLDLGFKDEVNEVLEILHDKKSLFKLCKLLVTASFNEKMEKLCFDGLLIEKEEQELVGSQKINSLEEMMETFEIPASLKQNFVVISERQKFTVLFAQLSNMQDKKGIIFVATADQANYLDKLLNCLQFSFHNAANKLHTKRILGDTKKVYKQHSYITQVERTKTFQDFNEDPCAWQISTDIGCRGLDFKGTELIIVFDVPQDMSDYINRIGRTARISEVGSSLLFLNYSEERFTEKIMESFNIFKYNPSQIFKDFFENVRAESQWENSHQYIDSLIQKFVRSHSDNYYLARRAYNSFCRAYARLRDKECFNLKDQNLLAIVIFLYKK